MSTLIVAFVMALACVLAAAFVVVPLWRTRRDAEVRPETVDLAARRARLSELDAERESGAIGEAEYREARTEAERELIEQDTDSASPVDSVESATAARWTGGVVAVVVPLLAVGVYLQLGSPNLIDGRTTPSLAAGSAGEVDRSVIAERLPELEQRVAQRPGDVEAAQMLARAYRILEQPEQAAAALATAIDHNGDIPALLVERAQALAAQTGGEFRGEAVAMLDRALARAPAYPDALWLRGLAAARAGQWERTRALWQRLLPQLPPQGEAAANLRVALDQLPNAAADAAEPSLQVRVQLADGLAAELAADTSVFVFAREADGPPMPLAAAKTTLGALPATLALDGAMARASGRSLDDVERLEIVARVSRSGQPAAAEGDLEGRIGPVMPEAEPVFTVTVDTRL